ncbi:UNC-50 family-domain-containing protein [Lipomyces orientalis]|uniref:UNC-50 family-domain-containing protein n=1 Tax=Lipomyces orientalis TaxID=1233043 RepID=A0ACC3TFR4_9ASCO
MALSSIRRTLTPDAGDRASPMSILPISDHTSFSAPPSPTASVSSSARRQSRFSRHSNSTYANFTSLRLPVVLRRLFKPPTLDFETAIWEICYLFIAPKKVYRQIYYHVQTKNTWARDDPSFVLLLSGFLMLSAVAWGIAYSPGFFPIIRLMFNIVFVDFLLIGSIIATIGWLLAGRFLRQRSTRGIMSMAQQDNKLEWAYCFDVHCNSFLIIWFSLYVLQFVMLPIIIKDNWFSLLLGNSLYLGAFSYYVVITYLGYSALPFLDHTEMLLFPILAFVVLFLASLFGFNISRHAVKFYFGS